MPKINKHIEIVMTSTSNLDIMGLKNCKAICNALRSHYTKVDFTIIKKKSDLKKLIQKKPDLVFSGIKYMEFETKTVTKDSLSKVWLAEYLDEAGINYTGSPKAAIELEFDKGRAKQKIQQCGIRTASFFIARPEQYQNSHELPVKFPLFIKPLYQGCGKGIGQDSVVSDFESYQKKVQAVYDQYKQPVLIEEYLSGREFTVAILDLGSENELLAMPVELIAQANDQGDRILGIKEKEADQEEVVAITDKKIHKNVISLAVQTFRALGARDFGRIDIRMNKQGVLFFLEANLVPGFGSGYFFRACSINKMMSYHDMILKIVEISSRRIVPRNNLTPHR